MAKLTEQIERFARAMRGSRRDETSRRFTKTVKHRGERRRAKRDPECMSLYRRYSGWEF